MRDNLEVATELLQQVSSLPSADAEVVARCVLDEHGFLPHGYGFADASAQLGHIETEDDFLAAVEMAVEERSSTSR